VTETGGFVSEMRRQADLGVLWWTTKWGALALLVVASGLLILAQSEDDNLPWGVGILLVGLVWLAYVARHAWQMCTSSRHPLDVELAAFGDAAVVRAIDADFSGKPFAAGRVHVGRGWSAM
jgi:hypothetical protein